MISLPCRLPTLYTDALNNKLSWSERSCYTSNDVAIDVRLRSDPPHSSTP